MIPFIHKDLETIVSPVKAIAVAVTNYTDAHLMFQNHMTLQYVYCLKDDGTYTMCNNLHDCNEYYNPDGKEKVQPLHPGDIWANRNK